MNQAGNAGQLSNAEQNNAEQNKLSSLFKKAGIGILVFIFVVYMITWIFSPLVAQWQIDKSLEPLDLKLSKETSIRLNPFLLKLSVYDLGLLRKSTGDSVASIKEAIIDLNTFALFNSKIELEHFFVGEVGIDSLINDQKTEVAGVTLDAESQEPLQDSKPLSQSVDETKPELETSSSQDSDNEWRVSSDLIKLENIVLDLKHFNQQHRLHIYSLAIEQLDLSGSSQSLLMKLKATINNAPLNLVSKIDLEKGLGQLSNEFNLTNFDLSKINYLIEQHASALTGNYDLSFVNEIDLTESGFNAKVSNLVTALTKLGLDSQGMTITVEKIEYQVPQVETALDNTGISASATDFSLDVYALNTHQENQNDLIAGFSRIALNQGNLELPVEQDFKFTLESLTIDDAIFSKSFAKSAADEFPVLSQFKQFVVSQLKFHDSHLSVAELSLDTLKADVILNQDKALANLVLPLSKAISTEHDELKDTEQLEQVESGDTESSEKDFTFKLDRFTISEESKISFTDQSVSPAFNQSILLTKFEISNITNKNVDEKINFDLSLKTDEFAETSLQGDITPFSEKLNFTLNGKINEFDLPKISPYLKDAMGFEMLSGQFDTAIQLAIVEDKIEGDTKLNIRGIELSSAEEKSETTDNQQSTTGAMPLNAALNMLKDDNGNLELDVPLSGDVSEPDFGVSSFVALVSKKAIMAAAQSYLLESFIPYANVLSVVMAAGEYMLEVQIEPLNYQATQIELAQEQIEYVSQLAQLMKDQPESQLKICSIASIKDLPAEPVSMEDDGYISKLNQISQTRGTKLKQWLVEAGGIESARLLLCQPQFDKSDAGLPRVEFEI